MPPRQRVRWTPEEDALLTEAVENYLAWGDEPEYAGYRVQNGNVSWQFVVEYMREFSTIHRTVSSARDRYLRIRLGEPAAPAPVVAQGVPVAFGFEVHAIVNLN